MRVPVILTLFLALTTVFSLYAVEYTQGLPTTQTSSQVDSTYVLRGNYDYVATLAPNLLYNTTVQTLGNGDLFVSITKSINVTFTLTLSSTAPADATVDSRYVATLWGGAWNTTLDRGANETRMQNGNSVVISKTFQFNMTMIQQLIKGLEVQLKYIAPLYVIEIRPAISGSLSTSGRTVNLDMPAPFNLTMSNGVISANGTEYSQNGTITSPINVSDTDNIRLHTISYLAFSVSLGGTAACGIYSVRPGRGKKTANQAEELEIATRPYREIIAASKSPPEGERRITMEKWEDLVKVADTLGKPILEFNGWKPDAGPQHVFYVSDSGAHYVYELKLEREPKKRGKPSADAQTSDRV